MVNAIENSSDSLDELLKKTERISSRNQTATLPLTITQEPIITINDQTYNEWKSPHEGDKTNVFNNDVAWRTSNDHGLIYLTSTKIGEANNSDKIIKNLEIKFDATPKYTKLWTGNNGTLTMFSGSSAGTVFQFDSKGNGIQLGKDGTGELKVQFGLNMSYSKDLTANLTFSNNAGDDALKGNVLIIGGYGNYDPAPAKPMLIANFDGNLNGSINQKAENGGYTPYSEFNFTKGDITGNVNIQIGGLTLKFANGGVKGNVAINTPGNATTIVKLIRTTGADLSIGTTNGFLVGKLSTSGTGNTNFTVGYADTVKTGNKVISLNPEDSEKFNITRGNFTFYNMKAIKFVGSDVNAKKTLTLSNGKIDNATFQFDRSVLDNQTIPIIVGDLVAQNGKSIRLSLIDDPNITSINQNTLKTLQVDGSITVTGSGLSLFYNDRLDCFEAKVSATKIAQTGGFIGRNDAWFDSEQTTETIQATSGGTSHLVFDKKAVIQGLTDSSTTNAIRAIGDNSTQLRFNGEADITGKISSSTNGSNIISFNNITTIKNSSLTVENTGEGYQRSAKNTLIFGGTRDATITFSEMKVFANWGYASGKKQFNAISFNNSGNNTFSTGSLMALFGYNFIGKDLVTSKGYDAQLFDFPTTNSPTVKEDIINEFLKTSHQASGIYTIGAVNGNNDVIDNTYAAQYPSIGGNYINVETLKVNGNIRANGAINAIATTSGEFKGNIQALRNSNIIKASTLRITGSLIANESAASSNNISALTDGGNLTLTIDKGIYAHWSNSANNIDMGANGTLTIASGSIMSKDGTNNITNGTLSVTSGTAEEVIPNNSNGGNAIFANGGKNNIDVDNVIVSGNIATSRGINSLKAKTSIRITGNITTSGGAQTNIVLSSNKATLTLNGKDAEKTTHKITSLDSGGGNNILTLDNSKATSGAMNTTISTLTNGANLAVVLKGNGDTKDTSLTIENATALKSVALGKGSTKNSLTLKSGDNSIIENINVGNGRDLTITLDGANSLTLIGGLSKNEGEANISVKTASATLSGGAIDATALNLANTATSLTLKNSLASFEIADFKSASDTDLSLDGSDGNVKVSINTLTLSGTDKTISAKFGSQETEKTLKINAVNSSMNNALNIKAITLTGASSNNILDFSESTIKTFIFKDKVSVGGGNDRQGLSLSFKGQSDSEATNITFENGVETGENGVSTISITEGNTTLEATNNGIKVTNLNITGNGNTKVTFQSNTTIGTLTAQADNRSNLIVGKANATTSLSINTTNSALNSIELTGTSATLEIKGGKQSIQTLKTSANTNSLSFENNNLAIGEIDNTTSHKIDLALKSSTLSLGGKTNTISSLKITGDNTTIDLSSPVTTTTKAKSANKTRKTLTIGDTNSSGAFSGNLNLIVHADATQADQIIVDGKSSNGSITISAQGDLYEILAITREDNIKVAEISNDNKDSLRVQGGVSEIDGVVVDLVVEEDKNNKGNYYLGKTQDKGADLSIQEVASSALTVNYDLYLANFNSLNKRLGELRANPNSQGVWARVFGGNMSNDFGSGSKTDYVTAQGGYDYAFSVGENAKNYVGVAIAYGKSWTKANDGIGLGRATLSNVNSQMVEVGVYNSYVADSGWYNDTILKFDYIMSDFTLKAGSVTANNSTNNFAMILSDEFGYRYEFGVSEKGSWYIDPQAEVAFGYFNQSDFNQALSQSGRTMLKASQDAILTLRTRTGASLGKKFITEKGFASVYVGAFYEYDYIEGGSAKTTVTEISNPLDSIESNGRAIVNVGSNIGLNENARIYIDVEKSFGDKQRTFMQFNLGARYSF